jgi:predicted SAM-dependent methyltransferase
MKVTKPFKTFARWILGDRYYRLKSVIQRTGYRVGFLRVTPPVKLHLGCGSRHIDAYLNIDLLSGVADIQADCCRLGFLKDGIADHVLVEHMLEHLSRREALAALREWARLLCPGGVLDVEVPDLIWCLENFLQAPLSQRYQGPYENQGAIASLYGLQSNPGQFHKFGYTKEYLADCIESCGLTVQEVKLYMTYHPCRSIRIRAWKEPQAAFPRPQEGNKEHSVQPLAS